MAALLDVLQAPAAAPFRCKVARWVDGLTNEEHAALDAALAAEPVHSVHTKMARAGVAPCSAAVWWRHWNQVCPCAR